MTDYDSIQLSDNALKILQSRYLTKQPGGTETPEQLFRRVSAAIAAAELRWGSKEDAQIWEEEFFHLMTTFQFLPNSPTLMHAGTAVNQLPACFVLPVTDNPSEIVKCLGQATVIQKNGGGTGFNFSQLRPATEKLPGADTAVSDPLSVMTIFDRATGQVKQGRGRRGANIGILKINHPAIEQFINAKKTGAAVLSNFNISVGIDDAFMNALSTGKQWALVHPQSKEVMAMLPARSLWASLIDAAWHTGDPGLIFLNTINRANPTPALGTIEATNPCGEVPLYPFESCVLGSINVAKFMLVKNGQPGVDWKKLQSAVRSAIRFLDNVLEVSDYPVPEIRSATLANRKIGLGIMGWADLLTQLEIPYDTENAVKLGELLMQFIQQNSVESSAELAKTRGCFPNWRESIYYPHVKLRNATTNSIAPTGSISIIADASPSIEPLFALAFEKRNLLDHINLSFVHEPFLSYMKKHHLFSEVMLAHIFEYGNLKDFDELPAGARNIFKTALEISPHWHLRHQLAFQKYTDNAVSKTINLPEDCSRKEIDEIFKAAWKGGAKGITIFRNKSKGLQVLHPGCHVEGNACKSCAL